MHAEVRFQKITCKSPQKKIMQYSVKREIGIIYQHPTML